MKLKKPLFASLAILALAVPVTGGAIVAFSASPALAKGGNGKGGSDRGNRGDRGKPDRGKGGQGGSGKGASGNSASGNSASGNGGSGKGNGGNSGIGNGNSGNGGQGKPAKVAAAAAPETVEDGAVELHPSQLGSMNGALNANINAVLAHIRNGNTNGPVGALAGLAVADHNATDAQDVIDSAAGYQALDTALEDAGFDSADDYQAAVDAGDADAIQAVEDAIAALGEAAGEEPPTEDEIAEAEAALAALSDAETNIFDAWNKSGDATEEEKAALLELLRERLSAESDTIADTIGTDDTEDAPEETDEEETAADTVEDGAGDPLDPETQAMLDNLKF